MTYLDEAEIKAQIQSVYDFGGISEVLNCLKTLHTCEFIVIEKLQELIKDENRRRD